jgi:hypothetical protein
MSKKYLLLACMLIAPMSEAATCGTSIIFPSLSVCSGSGCNVSITVRPSGVVHVLRDNRYGLDQTIKFGERSVFDLGTGGRINFGTGGGIQAVVIDEDGTLDCTPFFPGTIPYTVDMTPGGWLDFSHNNSIQLKASSVFVLGAFSVVDGRLDIQSDGTIGISSLGEMAMPNVDIGAPDGVTLDARGDIQIGNLQNQNQGTAAGNQGVHINTTGDVTIDTVDSNGDFAIVAGGNINIGEIKNADSISLTINPPNAGVIKIAGKQTTDNPVICAATDDCNGFVPDGGSGGDGCNTVNSDPNAPNNCGGGAAGPGFLLLCAAALLARRRIRHA